MIMNNIFHINEDKKTQLDHNYGVESASYDNDIAIIDVTNYDNDWSSY